MLTTAVSVGNACRYCMTRLQFHRLVKDCGLNTFRLTCADVDRVIGKWCHLRCITFRQAGTLCLASLFERVD